MVGSGDKASNVQQLKLEELMHNDGELQSQYVTEICGSYPMYEEVSRILINLIKGRGAGGCGYYYKYVLENDAFVLEEARYRECGNDILPPEEWDRIK